jgi:hypothetical protein
MEDAAHQARSAGHSWSQVLMWSIIWLKKRQRLLAWQRLSALVVVVSSHRQWLMILGIEWASMQSRHWEDNTAWMCDS